MPVGSRLQLCALICLGMRKRPVVSGCERLDIVIVEGHSREVDAGDRCPLGAEMDTLGYFRCLTCCPARSAKSA
jgi:hypothetical protein